MESFRQSKKTILLFLLPALLVYIFIVFMPVVTAGYYSFFKWNIVGVPIAVGLKNYLNLGHDGIFLLSIRNSFLLMLLSLATQLPAALFLAAILSGKIKGSRIFKNIFFMPNIISSVAVGLMWSFIYHPEFGLLNVLLRSAGLHSWARSWLGDEHTVLWAIIAVVCWQYIGYHMILFLAGILNIPQSINESARIDGADSWRLFWHITLPMLKPVIKIDAILISIGALRFFDLIYVMTGGGPNHASEVMASHMFIRAFRGMQYGYGSAISIILLLFCLGITLLLNLIFRKQEVA